MMETRTPPHVLLLPVRPGFIVATLAAALALKPGQGTMSALEYDTLVADLANFLGYMAEPTRLDRRELGVWVLMFLAVLFVFAYLLKREFWKDVH